MGTLTILFAKATIHLLTTSIQVKNQFDSPISFIFSFVTIFTAVSQLYWINMGLARYDALIQVPVFYVFWTLFDVIGGAVYYDEFRGFTPRQFSGFFIGIAVIFSGVLVLAGRLKRLVQDEGNCHNTAT